MGANIDAITVGSSLGIDARNTMNYAPTAAGTEILYKSISDNVSNYRLGNNGPKVDFFNQSNKDKK